MAVNGYDITFKPKYGALYNWNTASSTKLAPLGWHVPQAYEWDTLVYYLTANGYNYDASTTGGNLVAKSLAATTDWAITGAVGAIGTNLALNNRSGFSAFPGGNYSPVSSTFAASHALCEFWMATEYSATQGVCKELVYNKSFPYPMYYTKDYYFSVRIVKN